MSDPHLDLDHARWARARDDYRTGLFAVEVCARHGLARSTFYARAHAERWRRADLQGVAPEEAQGDDFDPSAPRPGAPDLAEAAHQRLAHAVSMGRLREALGWARLAEKLRALAVEEENATWRRLHRVMTADALDTSPAPPAGPAQVDAEAVETLVTSEGALDSPDSFSESSGRDAAPDIDGLAVPLVGLDAQETAQREGWKVEDWAEWALARARLDDQGAGPRRESEPSLRPAEPP